MCAAAAISSGNQPSGSLYFYLRKKKPLSCDVRRFTASKQARYGAAAAAEVKSVPLSVIVYSEILFMDDERPYVCVVAVV